MVGHNSWAAAPIFLGATKSWNQNENNEYLINGIRPDDAVQIDTSTMLFSYLFRLSINKSHSYALLAVRVSFAAQLVLIDLEIQFKIHFMPTISHDTCKNCLSKWIIIWFLIKMSSIVMLHVRKNFKNCYTNCFLVSTIGIFLVGCKELVLRISREIKEFSWVQRIFDQNPSFQWFCIIIRWPVKWMWQCANW